MIKVDQATLDDMESRYPGIIAQIKRWEAKEIPPCPHCGSTDTADVQVGVIGRTINLTAATSKFHLTANGPRQGTCFCNACRKYFGPADEPGQAAGGFTLLGLQDRSLQAYKDWILGMVRALRGDDCGSDMTEEDWVRDWKEFWAGDDEGPGAK